MQTECLHLCPFHDAHSLGSPQSCCISLNAPKTCEKTSEGNCKKVFPLLRKKRVRETQKPVPSKANGKNPPQKLSTAKYCHANPPIIFAIAVVLESIF